MLQSLTMEQYLDWSRIYQMSPWGPIRDDLRFEVFRIRLLLAMFGDGDEELPDYVFPHALPQKKSPVEQLRDLKERWSQIQAERANGNNNRSGIDPGQR